MKKLKFIKLCLLNDAGFCFTVYSVIENEMLFARAGNLSLGKTYLRQVKHINT